MNAESEAARRPRELPDLLQHAVDEAARLLEADGAIINLLQAERGTLCWSHGSRIDGTEERWLRSIELRVGEGIFGRAVADRVVLHTGDYLADESFTHTADSDEFAREIGITSVVVAPLLDGEDVLGALGAYSTRRDAFDEGDVGLIRALADHAAAAIVNTQLIERLASSQEELARRAETERTLRQIAGRITAMRDSGTILQLVVDESKRLLCSDGAHLTLMAEDGRHLVPAVVADDTNEETRRWLRTQRLPLDGGINGLAASRASTVWTRDYLVDPRIPHEPSDHATAERLGLRGMAAAPLRAPEGEVIGTLAVSYREPKEISAEEIELLQGLADQAAIVVGNVRLYEQLRASEFRYRYLLEHSPDLVWSTDAEGRFTFLSETCERVTGFRADELIGRHFSETVHPDSLPDLLRNW